MPNGQKGFAHILLIIILALTGIGLLGYYAYKNGQIKIPPSILPINSPTPSIDTPANWETYSNQKTNIAFRYPENWKVREINNTEDQYYLFDVFGKQLTLSKIVLEKDGYQLIYHYNFSGTRYLEPPICLYKDTPVNLDYGAFAQIRYNSSDFVQVESSQATYRRANAVSKEKNSLRFEVCQLSKTNKIKDYTYYVPIHISYTLPPNYNQEILSEMDQILSTFKFNITENKAKDIVSSLPEVKNYLSKYPKAILEVEGFNENKGEWNVHLYSIVDNHTATIEWYYVDGYSGAVTKESER